MEVGGDWYDATELPDGKLALVIGDVVGHGVEAAAAMGQIRNALRAYAVEGHGPAAALERLNHLVQTVDEGEMTTLVYLLFDPATRAVSFASAGHPPPLVVHPDGRAIYLDGGRSMPLGVSSKPGYAEADATLEPGSTVLLYTDGLVERRHAPLDNGLARLVVAASEAKGDVGAFLDHLVRALVGVEGLSDDVAMLALRLAPEPH
jgi:serine phosphatase RsbU (regulator of sigma subunit)